MHSEQPYHQKKVNSVAVIGAGAAGAAAAAAFSAEGVFKTIRVFERRETPGGTWIYDHDPGNSVDIHPGKLPPEIDPPLRMPNNLPRTTKPSQQPRYETTPIYDKLTTNVPAIAMSLSDRPFPYGPFVPHWIPKQYIEDYFSWHGIDSLLVLNTTVEDVSRVPTKSARGHAWKLTLRRYDSTRKVDVWWEEHFDAVVLANGHYSIPFIPAVKGLDEYAAKYPGRVTHSKVYRSVDSYTNQRVIAIGNSASGHDVTTQLVESAAPQLPIYQSRRSSSRWDGEEPPAGIEWKPVITEYDVETGDVIFDDGSRLADIDAIIYCTGYKPSFPFWNSEANSGPLYDYREGHLLHNYQHTFSRTFPDSLGMVGFPRTLTFRSFEYQAIALARLFAGRNARPLPPRAEQEAWEKRRAELVQREHRKFHDIPWDNDETMEWLRFLFDLSGLPMLEGAGRYPPVLDEATRYAIEHVRKYPEPHKEIDAAEDEDGWTLIKRHNAKDSLHFI